MNNDENVEEVPLDLFDQVSLDDYEQVEILDLPTKKDEKTSNSVISIPADAYYAALQAQNNNSINSQSNN